MNCTPYQCTCVKAWNRLSRVVPGPMMSPPLASEALMQSAKKITGRSDFASTTFFEPLQRLVESIEESSDLHPFGRFYVKQLITGLLVNRLKLEDLWQRHPEILNESIPSPRIVLGLPRTGTSFLFNLLAQDPAHRFLTNWEATVSQVPPQETMTFEQDSRRNQARQFMKFQNYLAPQMNTMHMFHLDGPEECTPLLMQDFTVLALSAMFNAPAYAEWLQTASHTATYHHHKRILQTLQWKYPGERWLLKSPSHIEAIDTILEVYPDVCVIQMHRDPVRAVSSFASLSAAFRGIYSRSIDPEEVGMQAMTLLAVNVERYLTQRSRCDSSRFVDVQYHDLVRDPLKTLRRIYRRFDLALSEEAERRMQALLAKKQEDKSPHRYNPEEFGLTPEVIHRRFQTYIDAFDIPIEN